MGLFSWTGLVSPDNISDFFTSKPIQPTVSPYYNQNLTDTYMQYLRQQFGNQLPNGGYEMKGVAAYNPNDQSKVSEGFNGVGDAQGRQVPVNDNLKKAWNAWQPWDGGASYTADYITNKSGADPTIAGLLGNAQQYGTPGGYGGQLLHNMAQQGGAGDYPTGLMHNMAQWGGTGGPGNNAMSMAMQYGAPSQAAGQYASNAAQYGIASQGSGTPLANRAYGQQTAAMNYLAPFMQGGARQYANPIQYQAPVLPGVAQQGVYRGPSIQR